MANWATLTRQDTINQLGKIISNEQKKSEIFNGVIYRLETLQSILYDQEKQFYQSVGYSNDPQKALKTLQDNLDILNTDPGFKLMVNLKDTEFDAIIENAMQGIDMSKPILVTLNRGAGAKAVEELANNFTQEVGSNVVEFLKTIREQEKTSRTLRSGRKKGKAAGLHLTEGRGLGGKLATFNIVPNKKKLTFEVQLQEGAVLNSKDLAKLGDALHGTVSTQTEEIRTNLKNVIVKQIQDPRLREIVSQEFTKEWYDVNSSAASIKGFLGEIHAYAAARYLFGDATVAATGNIRDLKGQEIPIDLVINSFGFQIKNYRMDKNGITHFSYGGKAGNFIEERINPVQDLKDLLVSFFGLYAYHGERDEFHVQAKELLKPNSVIPKIFDAHLDNVMRISSIFGNREIDKLFGEYQTYYNTFFMISDKLVPASMMVEAMIQELKTDRNKHSVLNTTWLFDGLTKEGLTATSPSPNKLANNISIDLHLYLNVQKVLERAQDVANRQSKLNN